MYLEPLACRCNVNSSMFRLTDRGAGWNGISPEPPRILLVRYLGRSLDVGELGINHKSFKKSSINIISKFQSILL